MRSAALLALAAAVLPGPGCRAAHRASGPFALVLGIAQDGGVPQAGCDRACCRERWADPSRRRRVACLAIVDPRTGGRWMIDATPDFAEQLRALDERAPAARAAPALDGILLTHAHAGHYLGLAALGRETIGARGVPVHAMPRMRSFLEANGPWSELARLGHVDLRGLEDGRTLRLAEGLEVVPFLVPHRDELSETVGFLVRGPRRTLAWLPDIDTWERWTRPVEDLLSEVDAAYLDGTFFDGGELPGRDLSLIPHPFVAETLARFAALPRSARAKVRFVHLNHTNPALEPGTTAAGAIRGAGCAVAAEGEVVDL